MKYGVFDSRPQHSKKPFMFQDEKTGKQEYAIYDSFEDADDTANWMNRLSTLTTYVVRKL